MECFFDTLTPDRLPPVALSNVDRELVERCLQKQPQSWEAFVHRFLGLVVHVVNHSAQSRSFSLNAQDREDLCAEVFLTILKDDLAILRGFRGESSLATYLTVIARRVVVRRLVKRPTSTPLRGDELDRSSSGSFEKRINDRDEVQRLLAGLEDRDAEVVRLYHLDGHSYQEISSRVGIPVNSIGPTLSRARARLREGVN